MRLKNKNKYWNLLIASLISIPIISTISACSFSETRYKLKVLDYFLKTENDDYYISYEFNKWRYAKNAKSYFFNKYY